MIQYYTKSEKIISIFKDKIHLLKNFELEDYSDNSVNLRFGQFFFFSLKFKEEGDKTNLIISHRFESSDNLAKGMSSIGVDRRTVDILQFINDNLDESEISEQCLEIIKQKKTKEQSESKKVKIVFAVTGIIIIISLIIIFTI